jgi:Hint domain
MSTLFRWVGGVGPDWDSVNPVDTDVFTNWFNTSKNNNKSGVPLAGDDALFQNGGVISVGGQGNANEILVQQNTTVTLTDTFISGVTLAGQDPSSFDLAVDDGAKLIVAGGARLQNEGKTSVVGIGSGILGASGTATVEVDPGGIFMADALVVGDITDDIGLVTVNGAGEFLVAAGASIAGGPVPIGDGAATIGNSGTGSLDISGTPVVFMQSVTLGVNQGAVGSMSLDSSTWGEANVTLGAAGTGHMTIGAGATAALFSLILGSAQTGSGDLTVTGANTFMVDFLTVGQAGTGTAAFGAGSTGTFAAVIVGDSVGAVANMTMDGATWNASTLVIGFFGTGHATTGAGEVVTVNDLELGSSTGANGDLTIDSASLNGGTVSVGLDGTGDLAIESGSTGSVAAVIVGADAGSNGTLTIDGGANWNVGSLTVGQTGTGQALVGTGATATLDNILIGPHGSLAVTETAGSVGTVIAKQVTIGFGTLDLAAFGQVLIGATAGTNGAVAIGSKSSLTGLGLLNGNVVLSNGGLVAATAPVPGALKIDGNIAGSGAIQPLMTLEANGVIDSGVTIAFNPSIGAQVGDLVLDVPGGELGTITGFSAGNTIDLKGVDYTSAVFTQGTSGSAGTLTLSGGTSAPLSLPMVGDYASNAFAVTPVTLSGAGVQGASPVSGAFAATSFAGAAPTDTVVTVSCFAAGTRIATAHGPVLVEELRVGDRVVTADGRIEPVRWIGSRTIDCARHPNPDAVWPVRVAAGAFGSGRPGRDLFLSPDHAVLVDGSLVPVKLLVDDASIVQIERPKVAYYHIELSCHELVLAEGLVVESYLDVGDQMNVMGETMRLFPDFTSGRAPNAAFVWETRGAAPLRLSGNAATARARAG